MIPYATTIAFVLRMASYALAAAGFVMLIARKTPGLREHALVLAGAACLMASGSVVASDTSQAIISVGMLISAISMDGLFMEVSPASAAILLPAEYLCCLGLTVMFDMADPLGDSIYAQRQTLFILLGVWLCLGLCWLMRKRGDAPEKAPTAFALTFLAAAFILCVAPLISGVGGGYGGSQSYITLFGFVALRTTDFVKAFAVLGLAAYFAANAQMLDRICVKGFVPIGFVFVLALIVALPESSLGHALLLLAVLAVMFVCCRAKAGLMYAAVTLGCAVLLVGIASASRGYVPARFVAWTDPGSDPLGVGYQTLTASSAMANGGLLGTGLHSSEAMFASIPFPQSDYVFAAIVEELGIAGGLLAVLAVAAIAVSVFRAARPLPEGSFARNALVAGGALLVCQALVVIAGVVGVIPYTAVGLPFVAFGGSGLLACFGLLGIMGALCEPKDSALRLYW